MTLRIIIFYFSLFILIIKKASLEEHSEVLTTFIGLQDDNNLGHSGYTYLSTDSKIADFQLSLCENIDINETTCSITSNQVKNNPLIIRGWAATTVKDNILAFLSYLAHQKSDIFIENIDDSLNIIYEQVKKNNIKMMDLLPQLTTIAKFNKSSQFIALFKVLQQVMPPFCKSALQTLSQFFSKLKYSTRENLLVSMKSRKRKIDLYEDIGFQVISSLHLKSSGSHVDKVIVNSLGREFAILFSAIQDGKIMLTQPVLAVLMLNMRFSELTPDENEDFKFIIDILRGNKIANWSLGFIGSASIKCPYELVQKMMKALSDLTGVDLKIKEIAKQLENRLKKPIRSSVVKEMDEFFSVEQLNISLLFKTMSNMVNIPEIKILRKMVENGTVNLLYALKGFNRYFYDTPEKLSIAFIRRVQIRTPMDDYLLNIIEKVMDRLKNRTLANENLSNENYPSNSISMIGNRHSNVYEQTRNHQKHDHVEANSKSVKNKRSDYITGRKEIFRRSLDGIINDENGNLSIVNANSTSKCPQKIPKYSLFTWLITLNNSAIDINATSLVANVSTFLTSFMKNPEIQFVIKKIIDKIIYERELRDSLSIENSLFSKSTSLNNNYKNITKALEINNEKNANMTYNKFKILKVTFNGTKRDFLKKLLNNMLEIKKVRARKLIYYEVIRLYCILVNGLSNHTTEILSPNNFPLEEKPTNISLEIFLKSISPTFRHIILELNSKGQFLTVKLKYYSTNRLFLIKLCKLILLQDEVRKNEPLFNEIIYLLHSIYDFQIKFTELIKIDKSTTPAESSELQLIIYFLLKPGLLQLLNNDFDFGLYHTKGFTLKAILETVIEAPEVENNLLLLNAIKNYIPKITCTGQEADPVSEILVDVLSDQVDVSRVIEYGLNEEKLLPNVQEAFKNMWFWYANSFDPIKFMKTRLNVSLYDTRAEFIEGFLDTVETDVDNDFIQVKSDIRLMKSAILKTGRGREPVDYE